MGNGLLYQSDQFLKAQEKIVQHTRRKGSRPITCSHQIKGSFVEADPHYVLLKLPNKKPPQGCKVWQQIRKVAQSKLSRPLVVLEAQKTCHFNDQALQVKLIADGQRMQMASCHVAINSC